MPLRLIALRRAEVGHGGHDLALFCADFCGGLLSRLFSLVAGATTEQNQRNAGENNV
jgi:hypothetical protein